MCTDEQHAQKMALLQRIDLHLETLIRGRKPQGRTHMISDTQGFFLDYQDRRHLYLYSETALTLNLQNYGTLPVPAKAWTNIDYPEGLQVFTSGTPTPVPISLRATDEVIA